MSLLEFFGTLSNVESIKPTENPENLAATNVSAVERYAALI